MELSNLLHALARPLIQPPVREPGPVPHPPAGDAIGVRIEHHARLQRLHHMVLSRPAINLLGLNPSRMAGIRN
jgi:hypothetical protein